MKNAGIIDVKMIRYLSDHYIFSRVYKTYNFPLAVETDNILLATDNIFWFERLTQEFDTLFDYTLQEGSELKLLNITIIQSKYGISIDQIDDIMKNIIQEYWEQKQKNRSNFSNLHSKHIPLLNKQSSWLHL